MQANGNLGSEHVLVGRSAKPHNPPLMQIIGTVKNIQPTAPKPNLELAFPRGESGRLAGGHKTPITLLIGDVRWRGTMRNDGSRDAYVHTRLHNDDGRAATCTEILTELGVGHEARLRFELVASDTLRLDQIIHPGGRPARRDAAERRQHSASRSARATRQRQATNGSSTRPPQRTFPFGDCDEIRRLAEVYWDIITPIEAAEERRFEQDFSEARKRGYVSKELFVRVGRWKSVRQTPNYESNSEETVHAASAKAFGVADDATALAALMGLRGVALRTASAILQWMRPAEFPILDVRVVSALGWPEPASWDDLGFYSRVSARVRELARECAVDLRTMDRALWAWDKLRSRGRA
jgi:hypothetical protein